MSGTDTAADVPDKYDVVIDGYGYVTARTVDPNMPFRIQQAALSYSPTFVARQNVSNSYGDNAQDFFLTIRQRDWSIGEQQKYFRAGTDGRYWMGSNLDVAVPGQARLSPSIASLSFAAAVRAAARHAGDYDVVAASSTHLYKVSGLTSGISDLGAHGLGATPAQYGLCTDGRYNYMTTTAAGTVGVRRWDGSSAFSTFSATAADSLAFVNNTLFAYRSTGSDLGRYDTAGTYTSIFTFKSANGDVVSSNVPVMHPYGGRLLIGFPFAQEAAELWIYDGTSPVRLEVFPENFILNDIEVLYGIAYIGGSFLKVASSTTYYLRPAVLFWDGSQIGLLWQANDFNTTAYSSASSVIGPHPALGVSNGRLIFNDETTGNIMAYSPVTGGTSSIGAFTANAGDSVRFVSTGQIQVTTRNQTTGYILPTSTYPSSGYVISSLIDFDSSLPKVFRGIKVEFDAASDGDGGSVDIAYQVDSLTGAWTTLKTGATSGTEYALSNVSGHAIAVKVTLNKGTSTAGPTLRSMNVRGAPTLTSYRINQFVFDLGGDSHEQNPVKRRDGSDHNLNGEEMRAHLATAIQATAPVQVTDRTGTYTAVLEPDGCEFDLTRPGQWYAQIKVREV